MLTIVFRAVARIIAPGGGLKIRERVGIGPSNQRGVEARGLKGRERGGVLGEGAVSSLSTS